MKRLITLFCSLAFITNSAFATDNYACFKVDKKIVTCDEKTLLSAFNEIKTFERKNDKKGGVTFFTARKALLTVCVASTLAGAGIEAIAWIPGKFAEGSIVNWARGVAGWGQLEGFGTSMKMIGGGVLLMAIGGVTLMLESKETADGTLSGFLASNEGVSQLLDMSDEQLLDQSKVDGRVPMKVMQIQAAIHEAQEQSKKIK